MFIIYCTNCGFDIEDYPFCPNCGTKAHPKVSKKTSTERIPHEQFYYYTAKDNNYSAKNNNPATAKKKDKTLIWLIVGFGLLWILFSALFGSNGKSNAAATPTPTKKPSVSSSSSSSEKVEYTDKELETIAVRALADRLRSTKATGGYTLERYYNIDATRYKIGSIKGNSTDGWSVKGQFWLYNDYGEYKKSGTFSVKISKFGTASCIITFD